jgi:hypothetical protein
MFREVRLGVDFKIIILRLMGLLDLVFYERNILVVFNELIPN